MIRILVPIVFLLTLTGSVHAMEEAKLDPTQTQAKIRLLDDQGRLKEAEQLAIQLVRQNPSNVDVQVLLALVYFHAGDYKSSRAILKQAQEHYPHDPDIPELLARIDQETKKPGYLEKKTENPVLPELLDITNPVKIAETNKQQTGLASALPPEEIKTASVFAPSNLQATNVLTNVATGYGKSKYGPSQLGINQQSIYATSPYGYWDFTNLYYTRATDFGMLFTSLNYASRLSNRAFQGAAEAIVNISKEFYVDLNLAYANNLYIFPDWTLGAEGYLSVAKDVQISFGDLFREITPSFFNTYTASIQKYMGDYLFIFRPYIYVPQHGSESVLYTGMVRRYFGSTDHSITLNLGYGRAPDLNDLLSIDFITIDDRSAALTYEFPVMDHRLVIDLGLSYENQRYPTGIIRQLSGADVGVRVRF